VPTCNLLCSHTSEKLETAFPSKPNPPLPVINCLFTVSVSASAYSNIYFRVGANHRKLPVLRDSMEFSWFAAACIQSRIQSTDNTDLLQCLYNLCERT